MSDTTRVMRIITHLHISGPALQAVLLTNRLNQLGYDGLLVAGKSLGEDDNMVDIAANYGVETIELQHLDRTVNPLTAWRGFWQLYRLIKEKKPHIVHTHTTTAGFLGRLAARMAGVPVVVHTMHVHPFRGYYNRFRTQVFIFVERWGAYLSDSIITLSEGLRKELSQTYHITSRNRITVLPIGFDLQAFADSKRHQGDFRQTWDILADAPLVGIIGRLLPVKNHSLFLQAAKHIHAQNPSIRFVIVGDGDDRLSLEQQSRAMGLSDVVTFTGWQRQMDAIYRDLDVLVISSLNEGTPVPIIEALAANCPVVATDVGGIAELLDGGKWGKLVPSGHVEALCRAILDTLEQPPDTREAQETMLRRYSIDRLAQDIDSLYRGLLAKKISAST
ncbi:MAG: glycosyltransferase family 4 protein [Anaerolineae bacterium]|nr:glycosyltransferase family 4 protein [Anaerolineae bacterium]MDQ7037452.1 glycosyltransferase family 4 protein [Anaerolineae bacterium]